jgi:hypothetical protein
MHQALERDRIRRRWNRLTDEDLEMISHDRARLVAAIEKRYGCSRNAAEAQVMSLEARTEAGGGAAESESGASVRTVTPTSRTPGRHESGGESTDSRKDQVATPHAIPESLDADRGSAASAP